MLYLNRDFTCTRKYECNEATVWPLLLHSSSKLYHCYRQVTNSIAIRGQTVLVTCTIIVFHKYSIIRQCIHVFYFLSLNNRTIILAEFYRHRQNQNNNNTLVSPCIICTGFNSNAVSNYSPKILMSLYERNISYKEIIYLDIYTCM